MTHGSRYVKSCQCERCESYRARSREHARTYRHPDQEGRRAYKTGKQREYDNTRRAARVAETVASGKKACSNPNPATHAPGAVKSLDEFEPNPRKAIGVSSHCRDCKNEARKARYRKQNEGDRYKRRYWAAREAAIRIYGGQCDGCGDTHNLEFDHVNGDGGEHRKVEGATSMLRRIAAAGQRITDYELRLLCADCHDWVTNGISRERVLLLLAHGHDWPSPAVLAILPAPLASQQGQGEAEAA